MEIAVSLAEKVEDVRANSEQTRCQFHQRVYAKLLCSKIPKVQKSQFKLLFALSGSASVKAARKHVEEIDPSSVDLMVRLSI